MWIYLRCRIVFLGLKIFSLILVLPRKAASLGEFGIDKGTTYCAKGSHATKLKVEKGDFGAITSENYPQNYTADLFFGLWCEVQIRSCSACKIRLKFTEMNFPTCAPPDFDLSIFGSKVRGSKCIPGCDHLYIVESDKPYDKSTGRKYFSRDQGQQYVSISSAVVIVHCMSNATSNGGKKFHVLYDIIDKKEELEGTVASSSGTQLITSPNFPNGYALNGETFTYFIQNLDPYGHIKILFEDWDIAQESEVQVYDGLIDSTPTLTLSKTKRPALISESNKIVIVFNTGMKPKACCDHVGFKATYQYVSDKTWVDKPKTDCSSIFTMKSGGTINFNGSPTNIPFKFDCIWVIKRDPDHKVEGAMLKIHEIVLGKGWMEDGGNTLEIREGTSSESPIITKYTSENITHGHSWVTLLDGYYIRLRGMFSSADRLKMVYTSFNNVTDFGCPGYFEYLCHNLMCIAQKLMCDGIDHCGDNSDESPFLDCTVRDIFKMKFEWSLPYVPESERINDALETTVTVDGPCGSGFQCLTDHECIPYVQRCDQTIDCADASDEYNCRRLDYSSSDEYWEYQSNMYDNGSAFSVQKSYRTCLIVIIIGCLLTVME